MSFFDWLKDLVGNDDNTVEYQAPEVQNYSEPVYTGYEPEPPCWHNDFGTAPDYSATASSDTWSTCGSDWPSFE